MPVPGKNAMPSFPAAGSVRMVEDVLVIKLSDVPG